MKQRGRKSADQLRAVDPVASIAPPAPPSELNDHEAAVWQSVVATRPPDWFHGTEPLLLSYCKHIGMAATLDRQIDAFTPAWLKTDGGLDRYRKLADGRYKQTAIIISLARSMRLTNQSRYTPQRAATATTRTGSKPWEA